MINIDNNLFAWETAIYEYTSIVKDVADAYLCLMQKYYSTIYCENVLKIWPIWQCVFNTFLCWIVYVIFLQFLSTSFTWKGCILIFYPKKMFLYLVLAKKNPQSCRRPAECGLYSPSLPQGCFIEGKARRVCSATSEAGT